MSKLVVASVGLAMSLTSVAHAGGEVKAPPIWIHSVTATSTFASKNNAYAPTLTVVPKTDYDKNYETVYNSAWCEGKKDAGIGESVTVTFAVPTKIDTLSIKAGVWKTPKLFTANNIPTSITITADDKRTFTAKPSATERKDAEVTVGGAAVKSLTFTIAEVKTGKMNDSCITEIAVGDGEVVLGVDAAAVAAYPAAAKAIWDTLWTISDRTVAPACDPKAIAKHVEFPFTWVDVENTHSSDEDKRFIRRKTVIPNAAKFAKSCNSFAQAGSFDNAVFASPGPGRIGLTYESADTTQTVELAWRKGAWKAIALD